jgi:AcrR family transcriptional regulator
MPGTRPRRRKPPAAYHHGDLRHALLVEAARTIREDGVDAVTLRAVGGRLGVSRTALYRHFADKSALLDAVAREGFQTFRGELQAAWEKAGGGRDGFDAMGRAYQGFAVTNPAHYRVMFGRFKDLPERDAALTADATAAFDVLVDALISLQRDGLVRPEDPRALAQFIWATVHGVAMLSIDGQLGPNPSPSADALSRFALDRLEAALGLIPNP